MKDDTAKRLMAVIEKHKHIVTLDLARDMAAVFGHRLKVGLEPKEK